MKKIGLLVIVFIWMMGCNEDLEKVPNSKKVNSTEFDLPLHFWVIGNAAGDSEGRYIECVCELIFEIDSNYSLRKDTVIYRGTGGGHISRKSLDENEEGIALIPDLYFPYVEVKVFGDSIVMDVSNFPTTGSRFYDETEFWKGKLLENGTIEGRWTCAPFDIYEGGWVDTLGTATGTWIVEPIE